MNSIPSSAPRPAPPPGPPREGGRPFGPTPQRFERRGGRPGERGGGGSRGAPRPGGVRRRIERMLRRPTATPRKPQGADYYPEPAALNTVRIIPLGGVEEGGRNMT